MTPENAERLEQQKHRIADMSMQDCGNEHKQNAVEWVRRVESDNPPSSDECIYHHDLQNTLYLKSIGAG